MQLNLDWLLSDNCAKGGAAIQKIKSHQKFAVLTVMYGWSPPMSQIEGRTILSHEKNTRDHRDYTVLVLQLCLEPDNH